MPRPHLVFVMFLVTYAEAHTTFCNYKFYLVHQAKSCSLFHHYDGLLSIHSSSSVINADVW